MRLSSRAFFSRSATRHSHNRNERKSGATSLPDCRAWNKSTPRPLSRTRRPEDRPLQQPFQVLVELPRHLDDFLNMLVFHDHFAKLGKASRRGDDVTDLPPVEFMFG